jgi:cobalt-zinc-cadmium efflux system membrane fusion protein
MRRTAAFFVAICVLWGCTESPKPTTDKPAEMKVQTYKVTTQEVTSFIEATGSIQPDTEGSAKITSALGGSVMNIFVKVGDQVKKEDPLATIRSSDVSDAYSGYLSTLSQVKQTERIYNLNKQLFEAGAITKNDLITSEANYEQFKAVMEASKKKLEIYGVSPGLGFTDRYLIKSPMNGTVVEIQAHIGDRVDTSNPLMIVADPNKIMVVANIYDTEIAKIHKGKEVTFSTDIFPKILFKGVVAYISDASDQESKTIKTYIRITGSPQLFKQNMFINMKIIGVKKILPVVPKTALLYKDGKFTIYVCTGGKYELKEVKPAFDVSDKLIAVEGLKEGDEVVLSAMGLEKT